MKFQESTLIHSIIKRTRISASFELKVIREMPLLVSEEDYGACAHAQFRTARLIDFCLLVNEVKFIPVQ